MLLHIFDILLLMSKILLREFIDVKFYEAPFPFRSSFFLRNSWQNFLSNYIGKSEVKSIFTLQDNFLLEAESNLNNTGAAVTVIELQECTCSLVSEVATLLKPSSHFAHPLREATAILTFLASLISFVSSTGAIFRDISKIRLNFKFRSL